MFRVSASLREDIVRVLDDELHGNILGVHVRHFSLDVVVSHDRGRKHHSEVLGRHLLNS